jgi:hypothetical protein
LLISTEMAEVESFRDEGCSETQKPASPGL